MNSDTPEVLLENEPNPVTPHVGVIDRGPLPNRQHEAFCILISSGMSMRDAFESSFGYRGTGTDINEVLGAPGVNERIASIAHQYNSSVHMTMVGHLEMLAVIRDSALQLSEVGVAFQCERARGEVAGLYNTTRKGPPAKIDIRFSRAKKPAALPAPASDDSLAVPAAIPLTVAFA